MPTDADAELACFVRSQEEVASILLRGAAALIAEWPENYEVLTKVK